MFDDLINLVLFYNVFYDIIYIIAVTMKNVQNYTHCLA